MKELKIVVDEVKDHCGAKLKPGDTFYVTGKGKIMIPENKGFCMFAIQSLIPFLVTKQFEDEIGDNEYITNMKKLCCPDPGGVVFRIEDK